MSTIAMSIAQQDLNRFPTDLRSNYTRWANLSAIADYQHISVFTLIDRIFSHMMEEETLPIIVDGEERQYTHDEAISLVTDLYGNDLLKIYVPETMVLRILKRCSRPCKKLDASFSIVVARLLSAGYEKLCLSTEEGRREYKKALQCLPKTKVKWDLFFNSQVVDGKMTFEAVFYNKACYQSKFIDHGFICPQQTHEYRTLTNAGWVWITTQEICGRYAAYYLLKRS